MNLRTAIASVPVGTETLLMAMMICVRISVLSIMAGSYCGTGGVVVPGVVLDMVDQLVVVFSGLSDVAVLP